MFDQNSELEADFLVGTAHLFLVVNWLRLTDVSSQDIFYLFLLKSSFNHQLVVSIYRTTENWEKKQKQIRTYKIVLFL